MDACIHTRADVVDDSAIRQRFFDPLVAAVVEEAVAAADGIRWRVDDATGDRVRHVPAVPVHAPTCSTEQVAVGVVGVGC